MALYNLCSFSVSFASQGADNFTLDSDGDKYVHTYNLPLWLPPTADMKGESLQPAITATKIILVISVSEASIHQR
jgi:hypothetical protein